MRSIIHTSVAAVMLAGTALAQDLPAGCYHRDYSDGHLASHPNQVVDWMRMLVGQDVYGNKTVSMEVGFANQGHAGRSGHGGWAFDQYLSCWDDDGRTGCSVDCDGGAFTVTNLTGSSVTIQTDYLMIGDTEECGGAVDLAEIQGKPVRYRLDRVSDSVCDGL